jgi:hypothetical protein
MWHDVFTGIWIILSMLLGAGISGALYRWVFSPRIPGMMGAMAAGVMGTMIVTALFTNLCLLFLPFYVPLAGVGWTSVCAACGAAEMLYFQRVNEKVKVRRELEKETEESKPTGEHD